MDLTRDEIAAITGPAGPIAAGTAVARGFALRLADARRRRPASSRCAPSATATTSSPTRSPRGATLARRRAGARRGGRPARRRRRHRAPRSRALGASRRATGSSGAAVIGITGSAGKTSTKDLTAAALAPGVRGARERGVVQQRDRAPGHAARRARRAPRRVVLEMGARFAGNIAELCAIARPSIGVITNVGLAHAEHLGGPDGIAAVKGELLDALPADGLAVLNADCDYTDGAPRRGPRAGAHRRARRRRRRPHVRGPARRRAAGDVPARLALGERADGAARGARRLPGRERGAGGDGRAAPRGAARRGRRGARRRRRPRRGGWSSPTSPTGSSCSTTPTTRARRSMRAALESFAQPRRCAGRRIAVLGEMRELGDDRPRPSTRGVGELVADAGVVALVVVGAGTDELAAAAAGARASRCTTSPTATPRWRSSATLVAPGRRGAREGEPARSGSSGSPTALLRRRAEEDAPMIAVLIAVSVAFLVSVLGTPFLIRILRARNIGQQIRDDGPIAHPHEHKAGTPTMGGIAIIVAAFLGYLVVAHPHRGDQVRRHRDRALVPHPRARVRRLARRLPRRAPGPEPRAAQAGQDRRDPHRHRRVRAARARVREGLDPPVVHPRRSTSTSGPSAGSCGRSRSSTRPRTR